MTAQIRNRILGLFFLAIALIWTAIVYKTIPSVDGSEEYGPRAFPLFFGVMLALSSILMIAGSWAKRAVDKPGEDGPRVDRTEVLGVSVTIALIAGYGFLMEKIGFVIATPIVISIILVFLLNVRSVVFVSVFSLGFTAGLYVVFNQLLGAYLPPGSWITVF